MGDLTVLLGPNGSGKSTVLRELAMNFVEPDVDALTVEGAWSHSE